MTPPFAYFGEALAALTALLYALGSVAISRGTRRERGDNGAILSTLITGLGAGALWLAAGEGLGVLAARPGFWAGVAWFAASGLCATLLGRLMLYKSVQAIGVARTTIVNRLNPFFSVLIAVLALGETLGGGALAGIALIAAAIAVLTASGRIRPQRVTEAPGLAAYRFGVAAAVGFGVGSVARKIGVGLVPEAPFGAMISAMAAFGFYLAAAPFVADYRRALREVGRGADRWQVVAALCLTGGQISSFGAMIFAPLSRVAMIVSTELFLAILLSSVVFRIEKPPGALVYAAAGLAGLGAVLIATG